MSSVELDGARVLVTFNVDNDIQLGDRTEAAIKTKSLLGAKILEVTPRGDGQLSQPDPARPHHARPTSCPTRSAISTTTISGLNTDTAVATRWRCWRRHFQGHPAGAEGRRRGRRAVLPDPRRPRRAAAQPAGQRQQGDRGAGPAQRPGRQPDRQHQCAAGAAADPKRRAGTDFAQHLGARPAAVGLHRRQP